MENFLHKIFSEKIDGSTHEELIKFGKGKYENRYLIEGKKQKDKWMIKTGPEFANYLVKKCLEKASGELEINGIIISTFDLRKDKGYLFEHEEKVKQFMGIKQLVVSSKRKPQEIVDVMNKYPKAFYALSFSTEKNELKIKAKTPKSAKPSSSREKTPKADFCSLKTTDFEIVKDIFFDFPNFKEIKIKHLLQIDAVILPEDEKDPVKIREMAKKRGKIIREIEIDGRKEIRNIEFEV